MPAIIAVLCLAAFVIGYVTRAEVQNWPQSPAKAPESLQQRLAVARADILAAADLMLMTAPRRANPGRKETL